MDHQKLVDDGSSSLMLFFANKYIWGMKLIFISMALWIMNKSHLGHWESTCYWRKTNAVKKCTVWCTLRPEWISARTFWGRNWQHCYCQWCMLSKNAERLNQRFEVGWHMVSTGRATCLHIEGKGSCQQISSD